jgi:hypothetical protein
MPSVKTLSQPLLSAIPEELVRRYDLYDELVEALKLCLINADTAARYVSETMKDSGTLKNAPHWPGMKAARAVLAKAERKEAR